MVNYTGIEERDGGLRESSSEDLVRCSGVRLSSATSAAIHHYLLVTALVRGGCTESSCRRSQQSGLLIECLTSSKTMKQFMRLCETL